MADDTTKIRKKYIISLILGCCFGTSTVRSELKLPLILDNVFVMIGIIFTAWKVK